MNMGTVKNLKAGFKACGICPFDPANVLKQLQSYNERSCESPRAVQNHVSEAVCGILKTLRQGNEKKADKRRKFKVQQEKNISIEDICKQDEDQGIF